MRLGGRVAAAIDILKDMDARHRPASEALKGWGLSHRFAGAADRAVIGNLVYDALRARASLAWAMGGDSPRLILFGVLSRVWGLDIEVLKTQFASDRFAPKAPTDSEALAYRTGTAENAPDWIRADIPEWLWETFAETFEDDAVAEGRAFAARPPLDLRVNTLKGGCERVRKHLAQFDAEPTPIARFGLRIPPPAAAGRLPNVQAEAGYRKGWFEVQDAGSQVAVDLVFAKPGEMVLDLCAGAGGKTLALAAVMENKGQVFAFDRDRHRLAPIHERLKRAGTRNVQVVGTDTEKLAPCRDRMDRVLVDAPCTGTGTWRRRPDIKWKLTAEMLEARMAEQAAVLDEAAAFVRPGGVLCYVTCSILPQENEAQVYAFVQRRPEFTLLSAGEVWEELFGTGGPKPWSADGCTVTMTPASTGTDGFFFAVLQRAGT